MSAARRMGPALGRAVAQMGRAGREGVADLRRAWTRRHASWVGAYALLAALGPVALPPSDLSTVASALYVALAAVGLNFSVGLAGLPSLAQGAFVGIGAFAVALLTSGAGWAVGTATLAGVALAAAAGIAAGAGSIRLPPWLVAVGTWAFAWMTGIALAAFPLFGGAQGVAVGPLPGPGGALPGGQLTVAGHYEVALAALAVALAVHLRLRRGPDGGALRLANEAPAAARAVGIDPGPRRLGLFVAGAAVGGLAGGLGVQLAGVADPGEYGPLLSVELFVAVVLGGATTLGPVAGAAALALIGPISRAVAGATGSGAERLEAVVAAALLAVALAVRAGFPLTAGSADRGRSRARRQERRQERRRVGGRARGRRVQPSEPVLVAAGIRVRFGGVVALDGVDLSAHPGEIHAVIGPNGSGKTSLLRALAGSVRPEAGWLHLDGLDLSDRPPRERVRVGLVRTLQRTATAPALTALDHVTAGADVRRRAGAIRALAGTPQSREDRARLRALALELLREAGLGGRQHDPVGSLDGGEQRLLAIATALATRPRVLLMDEPAAGLGGRARDHLRSWLERLRSAGLAIVLVEHDVRLVRDVADRVTVLDAGTVIAHGPPERVARDPAVVSAYLGPPVESGARPRPSGDLSGWVQQTENPR